MLGRTPSCRVFTAVALIVAMAAIAPDAEAAPAFFVFGDSLVDSGNNNYLATPSSADSPPYGIDFPTHRPTGSFSNGLNFPDIISEQIGSERVLPYLSSELTGQKLLIGANFASAGIGILNETGVQFVTSIRIFRQFELFQQYQQRLTALVGAEQAARLVNSALVLITLGGNDWVNNYFVQPVSPRRRQYSVPAFSTYLISEYRKILLVMYFRLERIFSPCNFHKVPLSLIYFSIATNLVLVVCKGSDLNTLFSPHSLFPFYFSVWLNNQKKY
ncbi:unnamed protein product [Malus baccata var. baccata]